VLVAGGIGERQSELFDPRSGTFSPAGSLKYLTTSMSIAVGSKVLTVGNYGTGAIVEVWDPTANDWTNWFELAATLHRNDATLSLLPNGNVLVAGGYNFGGVPNADLIDPKTRKVTVLPNMKRARWRHAAVVLKSGYVLVAGGATNSGDRMADVELFGAKDPGQACAEASDCASRNCVDGVCCDKPCDGQCEACDSPENVGKCVFVVGAPHGTRLACETEGQICLEGVCRAGSKCSSDGKLSIPEQVGGGSEPQDCAPFRCGSTGACITACAASADCADGFVCDVGTRLCVAPQATEPETGCAVGNSGLSRGVSGLAILAALGLLRRGRRRRAQ